VDQTANPAVSLNFATTSMVIGTDGLALIAYLDAVNNDLKVFHCANVVCTSGTASTADSTGSVGFSASLVIGSAGFGLISYVTSANSMVK
jgi:hypothetical protein